MINTLEFGFFFKDFDFDFLILLLLNSGGVKMQEKKRECMITQQAHLLPPYI
jgi:hypothetical protein